MRRDVSLEEISDGKLYGANDMVKADCQDCTGCSDCCQGMGDTLVLDPLDVYRLAPVLGKAVRNWLPYVWILMWQMGISCLTFE